MKKQIIAEISEILSKCELDLVISIYNTLKRMRGGSGSVYKRKNKNPA